MKANKNRSKGSRLLVRGALIATVVLGTLLLVQAVLAYSYGTFYFEHYTVEVEGPDPQSTALQQTWVYRVTITDTLTQNLPGLSHNALGLDPRCVIVSQSSDGEYVFYEGEQQGGEEVVKWELEPGTDIELDEPGETHAFTVTVEGQTATGQTYIALKAGNDILDEGTVIGPICEPTAVEITGLKASSAQPGLFIASGLVLVATVTASAALLTARKED